VLTCEKKFSGSEKRRDLLLSQQSDFGEENSVWNARRSSSFTIGWAASRISIRFACIGSD